MAERTCHRKLLVVALLCVSLTACNDPTPNRQQVTPLHTAAEVIARAKQVFAAETAHSYTISETSIFTRTVRQTDEPYTPYADMVEQVEYRVWYRASSQWRTETTVVLANTGKPPPAIPTPHPPLTTTIINDGADVWVHYFSAKTNIVSVNSSLGVGAVLAPSELSEAEKYDDGLPHHTSTLLEHLNECYTATLKGSDTIATRPAYVLALTPSGSCGRGSNYQAPRTVWLDQENFILLRDTRAFDNGLAWDKTMLTRTVAFDAPIEANVFSFTPSAAATVTDERTLKGGLAEAHQRAGFPIFVPTYIPNGLHLTPPSFDAAKGGNTARVRLYYYNDDGVYAVFISESAAYGGSKQAYPTDTAVTLPNGITAYYRNAADWCNENDSYIAWTQDGTDFYVSTSAYPKYGRVSKEELMKVAASMSSTTELRDLMWPSYHTYPPMTNVPYTPPTPCPTPHRLFRETMLRFAPSLRLYMWRQHAMLAAARPPKLCIDKKEHEP